MADLWKFFKIIMHLIVKLSQRYITRLERRAVIVLSISRTRRRNEILKSTCMHICTRFLLKHNPNAMGVQILCVCVRACLAVSQYLHACGTQDSDHRHTSHAVSSSGPGPCDCLNSVNWSRTQLFQGTTRQRKIAGLIKHMINTEFDLRPVENITASSGQFGMISRIEAHY